MEPHPIADTFPEMSDADLASLAEDIKAKGLVDPIITFEGKILDGRHRFKACRAAGVAPVFQPFEGEDPVAFVVSKNLHRRHLTTSQRGAIANEMAQLSHGERPQLPIDQCGSQAAAAALMKVSKRTVGRARQVQREAPELLEPIKAGAMTINAALDMIKAHPPGEPITAEIADQCSFLRNLPPLKVPSHVQPIVDALAALTKREDRRVIRCWIKLNWPLPVQGGGAPGEL